MTQAAPHLFAAYTSLKRILFDTDSAWFEASVDAVRSALVNPKLAGQKQIITELAESSSALFTLLVTGESGAGKSSLINALVGGYMVRVGSSADLPCIHRYLWGIDGYAIVRRSLAEPLRVSHDEAARICFEEEERFRDNPLYRSPVHHVDWYHNAYPLLNSCSIIETPATRIRTPSLKHMDTYYYQGDAIIWVIDATKPKIRKTLKTVFPVAKYVNKSIGVITKWDAVHDPKRKDRLTEQAHRLFRKHMTIVPLSLMPAQEQSSAEGEMAMPSDISHLRDLLLTRFLRSPIITRNMSRYRLIRQVITEAVTVLTAERSLTENNLAIYRDALRMIRQFHGAILEKLRHELPARLQNDLFGNIYQLLQHVTETNMETVLNVVTDRSMYEDKIGLLYLRMTETRDAMLDELREKLDLLTYLEISYGYGGAAESVEEYPCYRSFPEPSVISGIAVDISFGITCKEFMKEFHQSGAKQAGFLWTPPKKTGKFFSRKKEAANDRHLDFKDLASAQVASQRRKISEAMEAGIMRNLENCFAQIRQELADSFTKLFISEEHLEAKIAELGAEIKEINAATPRFTKEMTHVLQKVDRVGVFG